MRATTLAATAFLMMGGLAFSDSLDDAEAKQRGVPIEQVMAEKAQHAAEKKAKELDGQNQQLKTQLASLKQQLVDAKKLVEDSATAADKAENEALAAKVELERVRAQLTPAEKTRLDVAAKQEQAKKDAIRAAIAQHEIAPGMTLDEAKQAVHADRVELLSQNTRASYYRLAVDSPMLGAVGGKIANIGTNTYTYDVTIRDGKVETWSHGPSQSLDARVPAEDVSR